MRWSHLAIGVGIAGSLSGAAASDALGQSEVDLLERIEALEQRVAEQDRVLARQEEELGILRQRARGLTMPTDMDLPLPVPASAPAPGDRDLPAAQDDWPTSLTFSQPPPPVAPPPAAPPPAVVAQAPDERIGTERPEERQRPPEVQAIPELGGVLTPRGVLQVEPSVEYTNSNVNRFTFRGIEVVEAVLLGVIEAEDADRDSIRAAGTFRYGVTDRLELEAVIPFVYRNDRITTLIDPSGTEAAPSITDELNGTGLGDIEFAGHYQINDGQDGWPFFVGNLRVKTTTGEGPFDIDRDFFGIPEELATGSGFWSIEPSITVIYPTDPAVLFANAGYTWNISENVDTQIGENRITDVDPGDTVGLSFGMGVSLNDRLSFTLGYQHDFIDGTTTVINGLETESESLDVGALLFGTSYRISDSVRVNLNTQIGVTEDAPDVRLTLRVPISFDLFR